MVESDQKNSIEQVQIARKRDNLRRARRRGEQCGLPSICRLRYRQPVDFELRNFNPELRLGYEEWAAFDIRG